MSQADFPLRHSSDSSQPGSLKPGIRREGRGLLISGGVLLGIFIGLILASQANLVTPVLADLPTNISQTGAMPVVEKNGVVESPFVAVVESRADAVVNISARGRAADLPWFMQRPGQGPSSAGSGFFFREDGYIMTNAHVVTNADELVVTTASGYDYPAKLIGSDPSSDLAVIKVEPEEKITWIPFGNSDDIKIGDWCIAIGNPFPAQGLDRSVTVGVISALGRSNLRFGSETPMYQDYIQTDASINPGNSGGPLLNLKGEVIGVNAAISTPTGGSVGISFAIPVNIARAIVPDLIAEGRVNRGFLGVVLNNVTERDAKRSGLAAVRGARIDSVVPNSPASAAGLRRGDIVTSFNGHDVATSSQFMVQVANLKSGTSVPINIIRAGQEQKLAVTVADKESFEALARGSLGTPEQGGSDTFFGMEVETFTPQMARELGTRAYDGVYVTRVSPNSPADVAGIADGTIILQLDNQPVTDVVEFANLVKGLQERGKIPLLVIEPDGTTARKILRY